MESPTQGSKDNKSKATKKLLDEKDKQIENLQKKLNFSAIDHPQTEEILVFKKKNDDLKEEVLDLKSKLLQGSREKQELMNKEAVEIVPITSQPVDTEELIRSLSQVSLKEKEITTLKEEKKASRKQIKSIKIRIRG